MRQERKISKSQALVLGRENKENADTSNLMINRRRERDSLYQGISKVEKKIFDVTSKSSLNTSLNGLNGKPVANSTRFTLPSDTSKIQQSIKI